MPIDEVCISCFTEVSSYPAGLNMDSTINPQFSSIEQQIDLWASNMLYRWSVIYLLKSKPRFKSKGDGQIVYGNLNNIYTALRHWAQRNEWGIVQSLLGNVQQRDWTLAFSIDFITSYEERHLRRQLELIIKF